MNRFDTTADVLEIALLKRAFGAVLDAQERTLLAGSPAARDRGPAWLRACLDGWKNAPDPEEPPREPPDLVARFEQTIAARAQEFQRSFPRFLAIVLGFSGLVAVALVVAKTGGLHLGMLRDALIVLWGGLGLFCLVCWWRAREILRAHDLIGAFAAGEPGHARSPAGRAVRWLVLLLLVALEAHRVGAAQAGLLFAGLLAAMWLAARGLRRWERARRLCQDRELWTWWYGRG